MATTKHRKYKHRKHSKSQKFYEKYSLVLTIFLIAIIASAAFAILFVKGGKVAFMVAAASGPVLMVSNPADTTALLSWQIPEETVINYNFKLSSQKITASNFDDATSIEPIPTPGIVDNSWTKISATGTEEVNTTAKTYELKNVTTGVKLVQQTFPITYEWKIKPKGLESALMYILSDESLQEQGYILAIDQAGVTLYRQDLSGITYVNADKIISIEMPGLIHAPTSSLVSTNVSNTYKLIYNYNEELVAGEFKVFLNNILVGTATDSGDPWTSGDYLAVNTIGNASFDDIKVTQGNDTFLWTFDSSAVTTQQYTVKGLAPGGIYYFAMKYEHNPWSAVSNSPSITTKACSQEQTQPCYGDQSISGLVLTSPSICKLGTRACQADGSWGQCANYTLPATEVCDKKDNDCDGLIDESFDKDGDGYLNISCALVYNKTDCDDSDSNIHPGSWEYCDGIDNDCDSGIDIDCSTPGAGYKVSAGDGMCNSPQETFANACADCKGSNACCCPTGKTCINNTCVNTGAFSCSCTSWLSGTCGAGLCLSIQRQQTRTCTPVNCNVTTRCIEEPTCELEEPPTAPPTLKCGDNIKDATEDCDGTDDAGCPARCKLDCTCIFKIGDGICQKEEGENAENSPEDCKKKTSMALILVIVLLAIFGAVMGAYFFAIRPKQQLSDLASIQGIDNPAEASKSDAEAFANTGLMEGFSPDQIKDTLTGTGWAEKTASSAVNKASGEQDKLGKLAEKHELSSGDADRAKGYIDSCTKSGFTPTQIKKAMLDAGWKEDDVESLLAKNPSIKSDLSEAKEKAAKLGETDLRPYITDQLNSGFTPDQIKSALKKGGWKDDEIEKAFAG